MTDPAFNDGFSTRQRRQAYVDATAIVEAGAIVDETASVWQYSKVRAGAQIGARTRIGGWAYVGNAVHVGSDCKIENLAQVFEGAHLEDGVFVGPSVVLANDLYPRAVTPEGSIKGADDWDLTGVYVASGASIGAGSVVLPGVRIGRWALVGAGSVVTTDVSPNSMVLGSPARHKGWVCRCALRVDLGQGCTRCGYRYRLEDSHLVEIPPA